MSCKGLHCGGCRGGGGIGLAVIAAAVLVIAAAGKVIREAVHVVSVLLEVAAYASAAAVVVGLVLLAARFGLRVRSHRRRAVPAAAAVPRFTYQAVPADDEPLGIEPPRPRFDPVPVRVPEPQTAEPSRT